MTNIDEAITNNSDSGSIPANITLIGVESNKEISNTTSLKAIVKHSWVSENPAGISKLIKTIAPNANILNKLFDAKGNCTMEVQLSDKILLNVVNELNKAGHSLLSPNFPQPGNNNTLSIKNKMITYKITINKKVK